MDVGGTYLVQFTDAKMSTFAHEALELVKEFTPMSADEVFRMCSDLAVWIDFVTEEITARDLDLDGVVIVKSRVVKYLGDGRF
jgi:hypothetical protein